MKRCSWLQDWMRGVLLVVAAAVGMAGGGSALAAETLRIGGTGAALGTMRILGAEFVRSQAGVQVNTLPYIGSAGALLGVASGQLELGLSARPARADEQRLPVRVLPYATTPFVMGTHSGVGSAGLTRRQLVDVYAGRLTQWEDGRPIRLILRPPRETDNDALRALAPEMDAALASAFQRPGMRRAATDQDMADVLERTPGALGPTTLALLVSERRRIKLLAIDGVMPSLAALQDGRYPLAKQLYLVVPATPSPTVQAFVDYIFSPRGQAILVDNAQLPRVSGAPR